MQPPCQCRVTDRVESCGEIEAYKQYDFHAVRRSVTSVARASLKCQSADNGRHNKWVRLNFADCVNHTFFCGIAQLQYHFENSTVE